MIKLKADSVTPAPVVLGPDQYSAPELHPPGGCACSQRVSEWVNAEGRGKKVCHLIVFNPMFHPAPGNVDEGTADPRPTASLSVRYERQRAAQDDLVR